MTKHDDLPPIPRTVDELRDAVAELVRGVSDPSVTMGIETDGYGKCVEAMSRAAYLAHEFVARELAVTGFQHGMSSLHVLGLIRRIDGPYMLVNVENALYPQYDLREDVRKFLESDRVRRWLKEHAQEKLDAGSVGAERVVEHWKELAAYAPDETSGDPRA